LNIEQVAKLQTLLIMKDFETKLKNGCIKNIQEKGTEASD
jgi:hypothetical protein